MDKVASFLGIDEASRRKREQERAIKDVVGGAIKGTGLVGRIWASLVAKFAVQVLGAFIFPLIYAVVLKNLCCFLLGAFQSSMEDFEHIHQAAQRALLKDDKIREALGNDIICEPPFSSAMNSIDANGKKAKMISLEFNVNGSISTGRANVAAVMDKENTIKLKHLTVSVPGGKVIHVNTNGSVQRTIIDV